MIYSEVNMIHNLVYYKGENMTPILTLFSNKGGVGSTSLIYHLSWIYAELGKCVIAVDLDPQANLTAAFLSENEIERIWNEQNLGTTVYNCVKPLTGVGDILEPSLKVITNKLFLLPGDVALSGFEDVLSSVWSHSMDDNNLYRTMHILSAFWQVIQMSLKQVGADIVLVDVGPYLGAITRSALIATDFVVIPVAADLYSLQGLKNLGAALRSWKNLWGKRLINWNENSESSAYIESQLPAGSMQPIGYICQKVGMHSNHPINAFEKWANVIPNAYRERVLEKRTQLDISRDNDPYCLSTVKHFRSLMPMAQELKKPIF